MIILRAPSGASESLAHAIELINRDLDGLTEQLDTHRQNEFWTNLQGFAFRQTQNEDPRAQLIADGQVNEGVRDALQMADEKITTHLRGLSSAGRARFWEILHEACAQEARDTKHPKARHGGGGQSA